MCVEKREQQKGQHKIPTLFGSILAALSVTVVSESVMLLALISMNPPPIAACSTERSTATHDTAHTMQPGQQLTCTAAWRSREGKGVCGQVIAKYI